MARSQPVESRQLTGYVYAPTSTRLDPVTLIGDDAERWNGEGEVAWYLGLEPAVVLAEWARHLDEGVGMTVWKVRLAPLRVLDLRSPDVMTRLGLPSDPSWTLDVERTRSVAGEIRNEGSAEALIVPSVAFLDRSATHANLVVLLDDREGVRILVQDAQRVGDWSWEDGAGR